MSKKFSIAVDAMGGDNAPEKVLEGINLLFKKKVDVHVDIYGDKNLIKEIKIFDVYEGENIPFDKKSIALKVTIQSDHKTLNESDLTNISKKIVSTVEEKAGAKLRS